MSLRKDIEENFRRLMEKVDRVSDKEAEEDFNDLKDQDLDNDGDTDSSDTYLHKRLGMVAKMDENRLGVEEPFYIEIAVRDARKAVELIKDDPFLVKALRTKTIVPYGTNVFATDDQEIIQSLSDILLDNGIDLISHQGLDEMSVTAGVPGFQSPYAFGQADDDTIEADGWKKTPKTKRFSEQTKSKSSDYKKMMSEMYGVQTEAVSYREYKKDESATPSQKVNKSIMEVNRMLAEIERVVAHNLKLKNESGVNSNQFWKSTGVRFSKINERIVRISNRLKELSK